MKELAFACGIGVISGARSMLGPVMALHALTQLQWRGRGTLATTLTSTAARRLVTATTTPAMPTDRRRLETGASIRTSNARDLDVSRVRRYLTLMKTAVSSKGQIVLPAEIRRMDGIEPGQEFDIERLDRGDYRLVRRAGRLNDGAVEWLLACPSKGFFVAIVSESTETL